MKSKLNLIVTILAMLIFNGITNAQEVMDAKKHPKGCPKNAKSQLIARDSTTKIVLSPMFAIYAAQTSGNPKFPRRGYGEKGPDRIFYDSFPIGACRICAATLTAQVFNEGGHNDALHVWFSSDTQLPTSPTLVSLLSYGTPGATSFGLWASASETSKTVSANLDKDKINQYIISGVQTPMLDVLVQDDTRVDSMQLVIWRY